MFGSPPAPIETASSNRGSALQWFSRKPCAHPEKRFEHARTRPEAWRSPPSRCSGVSGVGPAVAADALDLEACDGVSVSRSREGLPHDQHRGFGRHSKPVAGLLFAGHLDLEGAVGADLEVGGVEVSTLLGGAARGDAVTLGAEVQIVDRAAMPRDAVGRGRPRWQRTDSSCPGCPRRSWRFRARDDGARGRGGRRVR